MIGPAGPAWWRVPLELLDRLPLIVDRQRRQRPRVEHRLAGADAARRARRRSSGRCCRSPAPATRACSATRSSTRTCSAPRPAPGSGRRSCSPCCARRRDGWPVDPAPVAAFVVAVVTVFVTYVVGAAFGGSRTGVTLVLAGVAVTSLATAIQTFLLQRNVDVVREVYTWILGRLSTATVGRRAAGRCRTSSSRCVVLLAPPPPPRRVPRRRGRGVDARRAGRAGAPRRRDRGDAGHGGGRVGQRADRLRRASSCPHVVRLVAGSSYRRVLPLSLLFGAAFLVLADIPGAGADRPGRDADRRRHRVPRRAVLHRRAARRRRRGR